MRHICAANDALKPLFEVSKTASETEQKAAKIAFDALITQAKGAERNGAIALYQSYDGWSRHFSEARMHVVPFGMTTAIAILSWGWDRGEILFRGPFTLAPGGVALFPMLAGAVWLATVILMAGLTWNTYRFGNKMLAQAVKTGISEGGGDHIVVRISNDGPIWAVAVASLGFVIAFAHQVSHFSGGDSPTRVQLVKPDLEQRGGAAAKIPEYPSAQP